MLSNLSPSIRRVLFVLLVVASVMLAFVPTTDSVGQSHVDDAFRRALVAFALARGLNGVISVAQGTELAVQPAGVGVVFAPGEILDPINDLIERFSWIMMLATSSLGVQKILLSMSAWQGLVLALAVVGVALIASRVLPATRARAVVFGPRTRRVLTRVFVFLLLLRFMMPVIAIANDWVYRTFLEADFVAASASLEQARDDIGAINEEVADERRRLPENLIERARDFVQQARESFDIDARLEQYRAAAESISESTIRLVVVFLMQTLVFPLIFLYIVVGLLRRLTRP